MSARIAPRLVPHAVRAPESWPLRRTPRTPLGRSLPDLWSLKTSVRKGAYLPARSMIDCRRSNTGSRAAQHVDGLVGGKRRPRSLKSGGLRHLHAASSPMSTRVCLAWKSRVLVSAGRLPGPQGRRLGSELLLAPAKATPAKGVKLRRFACMAPRNRDLRGHIPHILASIAVKLVQDPKTTRESKAASPYEWPHIFP